MKDGMRFVDCDMHVMEPPDLFDRYLEKKYHDRVSVPVDAEGNPKRGNIIVDDVPIGGDMLMQQHRKKVYNSTTTQQLSGSRIADSGKLNFEIERG